MTQTLSKSDYVKLRYLGSGSSSMHNAIKRRKKTKHSGAHFSTADRVKVGGMKIVDEDAWESGDVEASTSGGAADSEGEDERPVVAVFDNRTRKQRDLDEFKNSNRWKKVARNDELEAISGRAREESGGGSTGVEGNGNNSTRRRFDSDSDGDIGGSQNVISRYSPRNNSDSDLEVDRGKERLKFNERHNSRNNLNNLENQRCHRRSNDPDLNPHPRLNKLTDDDLSPARRRRTSLEKDDSALHSSTKQPGNSDNEYDSDLSPPRPTFPCSNSTAPSTANRQSSSSKPTKTLSGAQAGLQTAQAMRLEAQHIRNREDSIFGRLTDDASGRNANAVHRKGIRPKGKKPEPTAEEIAKCELLEKRYQAWGRGIKQAQSRETRLNEVLHEIDKPLARHKGDTDLENHLKEQTLAEDPMLDYVRRKQHAGMKGRIQFPRYQGPAPPINRYGIMPGYRWDGVDRSNGFEERLQQSQSSKKADAEEYYKWSYGTHE